MTHRFASFEIDENRRELRSGKCLLDVQPRVFDLLVQLARNRERVVPKDELLDLVWPDVTVADGSLQRAVSLARRALASCGAQSAIRTFAGRGYRLCDDTESTPGTTATPVIEFSSPHEEPAETRRLVHDHIEVLARSDLFRDASRMVAMLRFLVTEELSGRGDALTPEIVARAPGARDSAGGGPAGMAVRIEAGDLRNRLRTYYATTGAADAVRIELPGGRIGPRIYVRGVALGNRTVGFHQEVRFLRGHDGTSLAYAVSGLGHPLIKAANWLSHLEYDHECPIWRHWWRALSERFQLIRYDERGCGLSAWDTTDFSFDSWVRDLESVVDATNPERFALLGISQGAAVAVDYSVRHPERVSHLVLYGGYAEGRLTRARTDEERAEAGILQNLTLAGWGRGHPAFQKVFASFFIPNGSPEQQASFIELQRVSCPPENAHRFRETFAHINVVEQARKVRVPTLVLHANRDQTVPLSQSRMLASLIPNARLVQLDSDNHILQENEPAWDRFLAEVHAFLS